MANDDLPELLSRSGSPPGEHREATAPANSAAADGAVSRLAAGIAHDFNNLLCAILTNADVALLDVAEGGLAHDSLVEIRRAAERASELAWQLLAYSGGGGIFSERIDLRQVVSDALEPVVTRARERGVRLRVQREGTPLMVQADRQQLEALCRALVQNAVDASPDGASVVVIATRETAPNLERLGSSNLADVWVGAWPPQERATLRVWDAGHGMAPRVLHHAFDPFFSTRGAGRGLGLAAARGIVQSNQGALALASAPGIGTVAWAALPLLAEHNEEAQPDLPLAGAQPAQQTLWVGPPRDVNPPTANAGPLVVPRAGAAFAAFCAEPQRFPRVVLDMARLGAEAHALARLLACAAPGLELCEVVQSGEVTPITARAARTPFLGEVGS
jgi:signal transduction histidine kinase